MTTVDEARSENYRISRKLYATERLDILTIMYRQRESRLLRRVFPAALAACACSRSALIVCGMVGAARRAGFGRFPRRRLLFERKARYA